MPKKDNAMTEKEMHDWLKSRGYDLETGRKTGDTPAPADAVPPTAPATAPAAPGASSGIIAPLTQTATELHRTFAGEGERGQPPTYEQMDWQQRAGQGAAREMARLGVGAGRLAGRAFSPEWRNKLSDLAEQVPGIKRMEAFADEPTEGPMEYLGMGAADVGLGSAIPSLRLGQLAARAVPATRAVPTMTRVPGQATWVNPLGQGGRWMQQAGQWVGGTRYAQNPAAVSAARTAGNVAERLGAGAAGGAVMDPEDPARGAAYGAGGAVGAAGIGRALQSQFGQNLGGTLARYLPAGAAYALLHYLGHDIAGEVAGGGLAARTFAHGVAHSLRGYHTPAGEYLHNVGRAATERTGTAIERNLPAGIEGGKAAREGYAPQDASDFWERTQRPTVTVPRRPAYIEQDREGAQ